MGQLSKLWDGVFSVFLRAICRQFDSELEAGTDYLHQEARMLMKSFPKNTNQARDRDTNSTAHPPLSRVPSISPILGGPDGHASRANAGKNASSESLVTKGADDEEGLVIPVNPPIGLSDNGWGRKRRRVSSGSPEHSEQSAEGMSQAGIKDLIVKMQQQLEEQSDKIHILTKENEEVRKARCHPSSVKYR
jgi:hypothetical protein